MSNLTGVTNFFSTANEGFSTALAGTISAGATTVGLQSTTNLVDGSVFVGIIEPGSANQQVFTGTVNLTGSSIVNVVWTRGTNVNHANGVTIVDYVTGTDFNMMSKGIQVIHNQDGTLKSGLSIPNPTITTPTIASFVNANHDHTTTAKGGPVGSAALSNPYKFRATGTANAAMTSQTWTTVGFNAEQYDTGNNFDGATTFTAPVNGFYQFNFSAGTTSASGNLQGIGLRFLKNGSIDLTGSPFSFDNNVSYDFLTASISDCVQLSAGNTIICQAWLSIIGGTVSTNALVFSGFLVSTT